MILFEKFKQIIIDENHSEHEQTITWSRIQRDKDDECTGWKIKIDDII